MEILEIKCTEILTKNSFIIHFLDKNRDDITSDQYNKILMYSTTDGSELKMDLENDITEHSVSIDIKITFPTTFRHPNLYESIDNNQRGFINYYNKAIMNNQTNCSEAMKFDKVCHRASDTTTIKS